MPPLDAVGTTVATSGTTTSWSAKLLNRGTEKLTGEHSLGPARRGNIADRVQLADVVLAKLGSGTSSHRGALPSASSLRCWLHETGVSAKTGCWSASAAIASSDERLVTLKWRRTTQ